MKIFFQIFISVAVIFGVLSAARAAEITVFSFDSSTEVIRTNGVCGGHSVVIHIFAASSTEPFYTAGSECADGKYNFQDDLSYWKISSGEYRMIAYDANSPLSGPSEEKNFTVPEASPEQYLLPEPLNNSTSTEEAEEAAPENFFTRFLDALLNWFADAVLKIKDLIAEKITVSNLCIGETCVNEGDLKGFLKDNPSTQSSRAGLTTGQASLGPNGKNSYFDIDEPPKEKEGDEEKRQTEPAAISAAEPLEAATSSIIEILETATSTQTLNYEP